MIAEQPKTHLEPRLTAFYRGQTRLTKTTHRLITFCYELMIRVLTGNDSLFMNLMILLTWVHIRVQNFSLVRNTWDCFTFELNNADMLHSKLCERCIDELVLHPNFSPPIY